VLTALTMLPPLGSQPDYTKCARDGAVGDFELVDIDDPSIPHNSRCIYVDPNPLESINGEGHNYFRSRNPYVLKSTSVFGEAYWNVRPNLKLTAGLRVTDDRKTFTPVPTQLLLTSLLLVGGGDVYRGYPENPDIEQHWTEPTGRLVLDWKPKLAFTDETLIYGSISRGYKGGGANPPSIGFSSQWISEAAGLPPGVLPSLDRPSLALTANNYPSTFKPEFVNALEVGTKNTLLSGAMMLNATAFYYDYKDYQVSKIVDRTAVNENFDAEVWGFEFETLFAPNEALVINANLGLLDTRIGKGAKSIDITNRTQGNPDYVVVKPWMQLPSNCVVPLAVAQAFSQFIYDNYDPRVPDAITSYAAMCGGSFVGDAGSEPWLPVGYNPANNPNGGAGFYADLEGNELPNSPHWTANIGAQYTWRIFNDWDISLRGDYYRQGDSYARVYNAVNDKLKGWGNANARLTVARPQDDLQIELYVKNLLDDDPITDAFINSDDSGLTTNVFVLDPRLIGLSIRKGF
jgi:iron complex outermembrane receptor protein